LDRYDAFYSRRKFEILRINNFLKKNSGAVRFARNDIDINDDFDAKLFFELTTRAVLRRGASPKIKINKKKRLKLKIKGLWVKRK